MNHPNLTRNNVLMISFLRMVSFTARDEDASQSLTYSLTNDDSGRFRVDSQGRLYKAKDVDYETQNRHVIRAMVRDNGNPSLKVRTGNFCSFSVPESLPTSCGNVISSLTSSNTSYPACFNFLLPFSF